VRPPKRSLRGRVRAATLSRSWTSGGRRDESLNRELLRVGVPTRNKRLVLAPQESRLRKPAQGFSERDIGGQAAFLSLHQGHHGTDRRIGESGRGRSARLANVSGGLMAFVRMSKASYNTVLVGLLGHEGQELANPDSRHVGLDRAVERTAILLTGFRLAAVLV